MKILFIILESNLVEPNIPGHKSMCTESILHQKPKRARNRAWRKDGGRRWPEDNLPSITSSQVCHTQFSIHGIIEEQTSKLNLLHNLRGNLKYMSREFCELRTNFYRRIIKSPKTKFIYKDSGRQQQGLCLDTRLQKYGMVTVLHLGLRNVCR